MHLKWSDKEIVSWSRKYLSSKNMTLYTLEEKINICHSTLWWCFVHRLGRIDSLLHEDVMKKLSANKHRGGRKCRMEK